MKIVHPEFKHQLELEENKSKIIVIENTTLFFEYVSDLHMQCEKGEEGKIVLSEYDQILSFEKKAVLLLNPFELDVNNRKIITKLYANLKECMYESELFIRTSQLFTQLEQYLSVVEERSDYSLTYDTDIDITNIFKMMGVKLQVEYDSVLEQLMDYIAVEQEMLGHELVFLVNFKSYLSEEEFEKLYEYTFYRKIKIVLVESHVPEHVLSTEEVYIIDKQGCEIY